MDKYTVKDFILYNKPCFSCSKNIALNICSVASDAGGVTTIKTNINNNLIEIDLKIKYSKVLKLYVNCITNKILTTDIIWLTEYLARRKLFLQNLCNYCGSTIQSDYLDLNINTGIIKPVAIIKEKILLFDKINIYSIETDYDKQISIISVFKFGLQTPIFYTKTQFLPISKFKYQEQLLNKIKCYLTFS